MKTIKLVSWNCAMALKKKMDPLIRLSADIMVIQECSEDSIKAFSAIKGYSAIWFGKNPHKGLAVIVKTPWAIKKSRLLDIKYIAECELIGPATISLYAVWAFDDIDDIHALLDLVEKTALSPHTIVVGDFNSSVVWDGPGGERTHSKAVTRFRTLGLESAYHVVTSEEQGAETNPTLFHMKNPKKTYHIDYAFLPTLLTQGLKVEVGCYDEWITLSDHAPLIVTIKLS